jgi:hypothetical protein
LFPGNGNAHFNGCFWEMLFKYTHQYAASGQMMQEFLGQIRIDRTDPEYCSFCQKKQEIEEGQLG